MQFFIYRLAQTVKGVISAGILLTYALQFYIVIDIMWPSIHSTLGPFKFPILAECTFRSSLVLVTCKYYNTVKAHLELLLQLSKK